MAFDPLEITPDGGLSDEETQRIIDYQTLVTRVFSTEEGEKVLEMWAKQHIFSPTVVPGQPLEAHGIAEGKASFVRHIIKIIDQVQNNYYQPEENEDG